jgi:negative regulator of genetic competence, sporulation and motility
MAKDAENSDDEYDFLSIGRKQKSDDVRKALDRVKSMVRNPEARDQYMRLIMKYQNFKVVIDCVLLSDHTSYTIELSSFINPLFLYVISESTMETIFRIFHNINSVLLSLNRLIMAEPVNHSMLTRL